MYTPRTHGANPLPARHSRRAYLCFRTLILAGAILLFAMAPSRCGEDDADIGRLTQQAESGDVEAQYLLGKTYQLRIRDDAGARQPAIDWLTKAYEGGKMEAGVSLSSVYYLESERTPENLKKALAYAEELAAAGVPNGALALGVMYGDGVAVEKNDELAVEWLRKAAAGGSSGGAANLGLRYLQGTGVPVDLEEGFRLLTHAYDLGFIAAASPLGYMYMTGIFVEQDGGKAQTLLQEAHESGEANATVNLFIMFNEGVGAPEDLDKALYWARQALRAGNYDPIITMSNRFLDGKGVEQNIDAAVALLVEAFDAGSPVAAHRIGVIHQIVLNNAKNAEEWLRKASDLGFGESSLMLGLMVEYGHLGKIDMATALKWYTLAYEQGNADAPFKIAEILKTKGDEKWLEWMEKAAARGNYEAMDQLAFAYTLGDGVATDTDKAAEYTRMSAEAGSPTGAFFYGLAQISGDKAEKNVEAGLASITRAAENGNATAMLFLGDAYRAGELVKQDNAAAANWYGKAHRAGNPAANDRLKEMRAESKK